MACNGRHLDYSVTWTQPLRTLYRNTKHAPLTLFDSNQGTLHVAGMASTLGAVMAFTSVACDIIIESHPNAWMMDPIVGYAFGVFFGLCGVW